MAEGTKAGAYLWRPCWFWTEARAVSPLFYLCQSWLLIDSCSSLFPLQDDSLVTGSGRAHHPPIHTQAVLAQQNEQSVQK